MRLMRTASGFPDGNPSGCALDTQIGAHVVCLCGGGGAACQHCAAHGCGHRPFAFQQCADRQQRFRSACSLSQHVVSDAWKQELRHHGILMTSETILNFDKLSR